jgi:hypothetical protein
MKKSFSLLVAILSVASHAILADTSYHFEPEERAGVFHALNEIKDASDFEKALILYIQAKREYPAYMESKKQGGVKTRLVHPPDIGSEKKSYIPVDVKEKMRKIIRDFCSNNPKALEILVEVCRKNPVLFEDLEKETNLCFIFPQTLKFDWAYWECIKIVAETKNGPVWKKTYMYNALLGCAGTIHSLNALEYAEKKWPFPTRAELLEEGDLYQRNVDLITSHVALWKEIEDIAKGEIIFPYKTKLLFTYKVRDGEIEELHVPTSEEIINNPTSYLYHKYAKPREDHYYSNIMESLKRFAKKYDASPPNRFPQPFYYYPTPHVLIASIMDEAKKYKSRDLDLDIKTLFSLLLERENEIRDYDRILVLYKVVYERARPNYYAYITISDSSGHPLFFIPVPLKKPDEITTDFHIIRIVYHNDKPIDIISTNIVVESGKLKKYLNEKLYPQLYDSNGNIIYEESQKQ